MGCARSHNSKFCAFTVEEALEHRLILILIFKGDEVCRNEITELKLRDRGVSYPHHHQ